MNNFLGKLLLVFLCSLLIITNCFPQESLKTLFHPNKVGSSLFSPNGKYLATTCTDGFVRIYDQMNWQIVDSFHESAISIAFSPDGKKIATSVGSDYSIYIHEIKKLNSSNKCNFLIWQF